MSEHLWRLSIWGFQDSLADSSAADRVVFMEGKPWSPLMAALVSRDPILPVRTGL